MMNKIPKLLFFLFFVKPVVFIILGLNIRGRNNLPLTGPAIIVANHNSHLDTMVIMSLYPLSKLHKIRPVAAADYFLSHPLLKWFSLNCIDIVPIDRKSHLRKSKLFQECHTALNKGDVLIIFPEGTRGTPEEMGRIKHGIFHLAQERNDTQIIPLVTHGLGKSLPRGEALLVPFNCDVIIGTKLPPETTREKFVKNLSNAFNDLLKYCLTRNNT